MIVTSAQQTEEPRWLFITVTSWGVEGFQDQETRLARIDAAALTCARLDALRAIQQRRTEVS